MRPSNSLRRAIASATDRGGIAPDRRHDVEQMLGVVGGARPAGQREIVARTLALGPQLLGRGPDERMEPVHGAREPAERVAEEIMTPYMRQLVQQHRATPVERSSCRNPPAARSSASARRRRTASSRRRCAAGAVPPRARDGRRPPTAASATPAHRVDVRVARAGERRARTRSASIRSPAATTPPRSRTQRDRHAAHVVEERRRARRRRRTQRARRPTARSRARRELRWWIRGDAGHRARLFHGRENRAGAGVAHAVSAGIDEQRCERRRATRDGAHRPRCAASRHVTPARRRE